MTNPSDENNLKRQLSFRMFRPQTLESSERLSCTYLPASQLKLVMGPAEQALSECVRLRSTEPLMSDADDKEVPANLVEERIDVAVEIRRLIQELSLLRDEVARAEDRSRTVLPRGPVAQVKQLKSQVDTAVAQAQAKADDFERQFSAALAARPVTVIAITAMLGFALGILTRPHAERQS